MGFKVCDDTKVRSGNQIHRYENEYIKLSCRDRYRELKKLMKINQGLRDY